MDGPKEVTANWRTQYKLTYGSNNIQYGVVNSKNLDDDFISIEAEDAVLTLPMRIIQDNNASGGAAVADTSGYDDSGKITFNLDIQNNGTYYGYGRVHGKSGIEDSYFFNFDNGPKYIWDIAPREYEWFPLKSRQADSQFSIYLTKGHHVFCLYTREENTFIDKLIFTTNKYASISDPWFNSGSHIRLIAIPFNKNIFGSWSGSLQSTNNPLNFVMNQAYNIIADFTPVFGVTIGTNPPDLNYDVDNQFYNKQKVFNWEKGSEHAIFADSIISVNQNERYLWNSWSDSLPRAHHIVADSNGMFYIARYFHQYKLNINVSSGSGGSVQINPAKLWYTLGDSISVVASPDEGYQFIGWNGDTVSTENPLMLQVDSVLSLSANFARLSPPPAAVNFYLNRYAASTSDTIKLNYRVKNANNDSSVALESLWYHNGEIDSLSINHSRIIPINSGEGDTWYVIFRLKNGNLHSQWYRTKVCTIVPVLPDALLSLNFSEKDTTITLRNHSSSLQVDLHFNSDNGNRIYGTSDSLENSIVILHFSRSPEFYFENTLNDYFLISGFLKDFTWSFVYQYNDSLLSQAGIASEDSLTIGWSEDFGNTWNYVTNAVPDTVNNVIMVSGLSHFSLWAVGQKPFSKFLPVEMTYFRANLEHINKVVLEWKTQSETNNLGFEIQRSFANSPFEKIAFVNGIGTSARPHLYHFVDIVEKGGDYTYRLKQIDINGAFKYSKKIHINVSAPGNLTVFPNYPNPFNNSTIIKFSIPQTFEGNNVQLLIYNIKGEQVKKFTKNSVKAGIYQFKWNGTDLNGNHVASGLFFYRLKIGNFEKISKMILLK